MYKKKIPAKRVDIVSLKLVKESSVLYETTRMSAKLDSLYHTHTKKIYLR